MRTPGLVVIALALVGCGKKADDKPAPTTEKADACAEQQKAAIRALDDARDNLEMETKATLEPVATTFPTTPIGDMMKKDAVAFHDVTEKRHGAAASAIKALGAASSAIKDNGPMAALTPALLMTLDAVERSRTAYADRMMAERQEINALASASSMTGEQHLAIADMVKANNINRYAADATEFAAVDRTLAEHALCRAAKSDDTCGTLKKALEAEVETTKAAIEAAKAPKPTREELVAKAGQEDWLGSNAIPSPVAGNSLSASLAALEKALGDYAASCEKQ